MSEFQTSIYPLNIYSQSTCAIFNRFATRIFETCDVWLFIRIKTIIVVSKHKRNILFDAPHDCWKQRFHPNVNTRHVKKLTKIMRSIKYNIPNENYTSFYLFLHLDSKDSSERYIGARRYIDALLGKEGKGMKRQKNNWRNWTKRKMKTEKNKERGNISSCSGRVPRGKEMEFCQGWATLEIPPSILFCSQWHSAPTRCTSTPCFPFCRHRIKPA